MAQAPCQCGVNKDFFETMRRLRSRDEKVEYFRKNKDNILPRKKCCWPVPTIPGSSNIDPRAVLWRQLKAHHGDTQCERCPYCIFFPALTFLLKVATHIGLIQPRHFPASLPEGSRKDSEKELEIAQAFIPPEVVEQLPRGSLVLQDAVMSDHFALSGEFN